ncbi:hypothetical protein VNO77_05948 [Canavalia gladiata]|uniref:Uncharacterized protein n=1 Tax=Canavalia gladiata TaxID=3824 RepID=A0AAN9MZ95_CANGL
MYTMVNLVSCTDALVLFKSDPILAILVQMLYIGQLVCVIAKHLSVSALSLSIAKITRDPVGYVDTEKEHPSHEHRMGMIESREVRMDPRELGTSALRIMKGVGETR